MEESSIKSRLEQLMVERQKMRETLQKTAAAVEQFNGAIAILEELLKAPEVPK